MKDGLQYIVNQHDQIRTLFDQFEKSDQIGQKASIVKTFIEDICRHASMEERYWYPLIKKHLKDGEFFMERNYYDDTLNKVTMNYLLKNLDKYKDPNSSQKVIDFYESTVQKFIDIEREHLKEEEDVIMPEMRDGMTKSEISDLEDTLKKAYKNAPKYPYMYSIDKPELGSKVFQPIIGYFESATTSNP